MCSGVEPSCAAMTVNKGQSVRNDVKLPLTQMRMIGSMARSNYCVFIECLMAWWISLILEKLGCTEALCKATCWDLMYIRVIAVLFPVWFPPKCLQATTNPHKRFLDFKKSMSLFRVCAVGVLLRLHCQEVTFELSWGQCFLFVSDLSGKKYMKTKKKDAAC